MDNFISTGLDFLISEMDRSRSPFLSSSSPKVFPPLSVTVTTVKVGELKLSRVTRSCKDAFQALQTDPPRAPGSACVPRGGAVGFKSPFPLPVQSMQRSAGSEVFLKPKVMDNL